MHRSEGATALLGMDGFVVGAQVDVDGELLADGGDDSRRRGL